MDAAVLILRVLLGGVLVAAGALKAGHPTELASAIAGFRLLPAQVVAPLALALPYIELVLGGYLVVGLFTRVAAALACAQFALYAGAIASAVLRHIPADCGCFGPGDTAVADWPHVGFDLGLALVSAFIAYRAPGARHRSETAQRMTQRRPLTIATIVVVAIIVIVAVVLSRHPSRHPSRQLQTASQSPIVGKAQVGKPAPTFVVATTQGLFDLSKATKPVFLEVFATWCPHCQREAAVIDRLYQKYRSHVTFVGVSGSNTAMDGTSAASAADVLQWARRFNVQYPVAYDPLLNVANLYLQGGFPTYAIIGTNKKVVYLNSGELSYNQLKTALKPLLSS